MFNAMLDAEAGEIVRASRYERSGGRKAYRAGRYLDMSRLGGTPEEATDHRATSGHDQKSAQSFGLPCYQQPFAILQILGILLTIYFARTLIGFIRQGLFAVTVNRNRGRCLELVWSGIEKQIRHLQEERTLS